jgi:1-deoxy-D-xylulose 5-phosphate reductoisomerase
MKMSNIVIKLRLYIVCLMRTCDHKEWYMAQNISPNKSVMMNKNKSTLLHTNNL